MDEIRFYDPCHGPFCELSNLHPAPLAFEGMVYATPEHAFQVMRARAPATKLWLAAAPTPELAAVAGDALTPDATTPGWSEDQLAVMARILDAKFRPPGRFRDLLASTGSARLVEWSPEDGAVARFWGEFEGHGDNHLGRLLMALRTELAAGG